MVLLLLSFDENNVLYKVSMTHCIVRQACTKNFLYPIASSPTHSMKQHEGNMKG